MCSLFIVWCLIQCKTHFYFKFQSVHNKRSLSETADEKGFRHHHLIWGWRRSAEPGLMNTNWLSTEQLLAITRALTPTWCTRIDFQTRQQGLKHAHARSSQKLSNHTARPEAPRSLNRPRSDSVRCPEMGFTQRSTHTTVSMGKTLCPHSLSLSIHVVILLWSRSPHPSVLYFDDGSSVSIKQH